ncbi:DNA-directed DNA polymerase B [Methanocella arvoryzae MRE50]|uniref:DNA-directed DNA polymerase B n=2 Tax=Methanocella TaxID=570266 RepID=Q0W7W4_METAR|nr:DNA-directed DNA polymerase B [Methanocella arvoryzae MRE50]
MGRGEQAEYHNAGQPTINNSRIDLVFDTETTTDRYQNLTFGSCGVWVNGKPDRFLIFFDHELPKPSTDIIKAYNIQYNTEKILNDKLPGTTFNSYELMTKEEFVENVLFPYVFQARANCICFNIPFDITRLAIKFSESRKYNNGFSVTLSENPNNPRIVIKHIDSKRAFVELTNPDRSKGKKKKKRRPFRGNFLDLRTFTFVLTNEGYDLGRALPDFGSKFRKMSPEEHGKITPEYITYNINDTLATYDLYVQALKRYRWYCLDKTPTKLYSPASIGKALLDKIGILPFHFKNPEFPEEILGYVMMGYYGGRTETRIRKEPRLITCLDYISMYPSVFVLLNMYRFLIAKNILREDATKDAQTLLDKITPEDIRNKELWNDFTIICELEPNEDKVPVRSSYGNKYALNIGINYLISTDGSTIWYTLIDLIAAKMDQGKAPRIKRAIRFIPSEPQDNLNSITYLKGLPPLEPGADLIKYLIIERDHIKKLMKSPEWEGKKDTEEYRELEISEQILKIIANSTSYGIFIQLNPEDADSEEVTIFCDQTFTAEVNKIEKPGPAFNPIMAVFLTAGSRLILATAEALITRENGYFAYCDTDSIFISPEHVPMIQEFFRDLNPYGVHIEDMFKIEDNKSRKKKVKRVVKLENVWLYAISAKRYVLYHVHDNGAIEILKYSSHGLGHLMNIDEAQIWMDILTLHYHPEEADEIFQRYKGKYAFSKLAITTYDIWARVNKRNQGKPLKEQIKPFNFILVGTSYRTDPETKQPIIPTWPYNSADDKEFAKLPYMPFIDYKTGKTYTNPPAAGQEFSTEFYLKPMDEVLYDYVNHPEAKSEGDTGLLKSRYLHINKASIHRIGKESDDIENSLIFGLPSDSYGEVANIYQAISNLTPKDAGKLGIPERTLRKWKAKIREGKPLNMKNSVIIKLKRPIESIE